MKASKHAAFGALPPLTGARLRDLADWAMTGEQTQGNRAKSLALQALAHAGVFALLVYGLIALNSWENAGNQGFLIYLAALGAFLSGLALSHIVHEWGHFMGAIITGSRLTIKPKIFPLFFDFDYAANRPGQFLVMSLGGLLGNFLLLLVLVFYIAPTTLVLTTCLAAVAGQLLYVLILELPVSLGTLAGREPLAALEAHFGQGGPLFLRATLMGLGAAALVLLFY